MDLSIAILMILNRQGSGNATNCLSLMVQAACLSDEIVKDSQLKRDQLRSLGYPESFICEILDLHSRKQVKATLDILEKEGFISAKQTEAKLLHEVQGLGCKVHPFVLEQLRVNLLVYKLTKLGLQRLWEHAARTQGSRT